MVGGFNVYPAEVERCSPTIPTISEVAVVIGVPDARLGEVGSAFVLTVPPGRDGRPTRRRGRSRSCRERLANFKVPARVTVVRGLPRTASGKVQKFRLTG